MDLKEYWAKPEIKVKRQKKPKPIKCSCGKSFADDNAWNQHMRRFGKKDHKLKRLP